MRITIRLSIERVTELLNLHLPPGIRAITVLAPVHAGLSGATVWHIDMQSEGVAHNGFAVAKFDDYQRLTLENKHTDEVHKQSVLKQRVPEILFMSPSITELDKDDNPYTIGFLLTTYARDLQAEHIDMLQDHIAHNKRKDRDRIADQIGALITPLFGQWYDAIGWSSTRRSRPMLTIFNELLNIGGDEDRVKRLDERLKTYFGLSPTAQRLVIDQAGDEPLGLDNPAYVMQRPELWQGQTLTVADCPMHGDLHTANVICQVKRSGDRPLTAVPWLIDFANYQMNGLFFYDLVQLEFDILSQFLPSDTPEDWQDWLNLLKFISGDVLAPEGEPQGDRAPHAWRLMKPIRQFVQNYVEQTKQHTSGGIDAEMRHAWWLSVVIIGVRAAQREQAKPGIRAAGLVYAGLALKHLPHQTPPDGNAVALLTWYPDHGLNTVEPQTKPPSLPKLPVTQQTRLCKPHQYEIKTAFVGRADELKRLDAWAQSADRVLEVIAIGGQGKSALTWEWFNTRAQTTLPNFAGGLWWSFYESDGAMSRFISTALRLLGGLSADKIEAMSRDQREDALIDLGRDRALLFVFDGLERILNAYRTLRSATQTDEEVDSQLAEAAKNEADRPRACFNPQDGTLIKRLAGAGAARILISTRLPLADLEDQFGEALPKVARLELHGLSDPDVLALFRRYKITGNRQQMTDFARSFESHGLLLALVIGKVRNYMRAKGDFDRWYADEGHRLNLRQLDIVQKRTHILQFALEALSDDGRALLRRLAVFNYPFDFEAAMAIQPLWERYYSAPELPAPPFPAEEYERKQAEANQANDEWTAAIGKPNFMELYERRKALRAELAPYNEWQTDFTRREQAARERAHLAAEPDVNEALYELEDRGLIAYDFERRAWDMHPVVRGYAYNDLQADDPSGRAEALAGKQNYFESRETKPPEAVEDIDDLRRELEIYDALVQAGQFDRASDFYRDKLGDILLYQLNAYHEIVRLLTPLFRDGLDQPPTLASRGAQIPRITDLANAYSYIDEEQEARLRALNIRLNLEDRSASGLLVDIWAYSITLFDQNRYGSMIRVLRLGLRLAQVAEQKHYIANMQRMSFVAYINVGQWDEAETAYPAIDPADFNENERARWESEMKRSAAEMRIARGQDASALLDEAERVARSIRSPVGLRDVEQLRGEDALRRGDGRAAAHHFERYLEMQQKVRQGVHSARGGLARALLLQDHPDAARAQVEAGTDNLSAAEVWLALGEHDQAEETALAAYKWLWGEGAPYAHYDLPRAEAVLKQLGVSVPALLLFDESQITHLPEEDRIIAFIEELEAEKAKKDAEEGDES